MATVERKREVENQTAHKALPLDLRGFNPCHHVHNQYSLSLKEREVSPSPSMESLVPLFKQLVDSPPLLEKPFTESPQEGLKKYDRADILSMIFTLMKLFIQDQANKRESRQEERRYELSKNQDVVDALHQQGKWHIIAGVGAGVFGFLSAIAPVAGYAKGPEIIDFFSSCMPSWKGMDPDKLFKGLGEGLHAMAELQKATGQINQSFSDGDRVHYQNLTELSKMSVEEFTRIVEEALRTLEDLKNFLLSYYQMEQEATRSVVSNR